MATDRDTLLDFIVNHLDRSGVPFALIGAAALALHGVSRSTLDIDLLVTDRRVLDASFWADLPQSITRDIRRAGADDPLAGVVRLSATDERDVDIVIGRGTWEQGVLERAERTSHHGRQLPVARVDDLVLLKLFAGGSQDRWDIEQLLARPDRAEIIDAVERSLSQLPADAQRLWRALALRDDDERPT
jgi:hypothetical protein